MSLLNINFLNEAVLEKNITQPNKILNHVRNRLIENISQDGGQDGMDAILICLDRSTNAITYSAANNAPILIRDNKFLELEKDKMPVGKGEKNTSFTLFDLDIKKGDSLYLFTDGYADQFGGMQAKKFKNRNLNEYLAKICELTNQKQLEALNTTYENWKGDLDQVDDICIIGIKF
jgi:serine phosphatase RsbU (regulator of sigma subunit)